MIHAWSIWLLGDNGRLDYSIFKAQRDRERGVMLQKSIIVHCNTFRPKGSEAIRYSTNSGFKTPHNTKLTAQEAMYPPNKPQALRPEILRPKADARSSGQRRPASSSGSQPHANRSLNRIILDQACSRLFLLGPPNTPS